MKKHLAIVDTSALIALETTGQIGLLAHLYDQVLAPPAVVSEFGGLLPQPVVQQGLNPSSALSATRLNQKLGRGESEVIALGIELSADEVIIDDAQAREEAKSHGLNVVGVVGLLLRAKQHKLIPQVKPLLDTLRGSGFRIGEDLYLKALTLAGEWVGGVDGIPLTPDMVYLQRWQS